MLRFQAANVRDVNVSRAVDTCLGELFPEGAAQDCGVLFVSATVGHKLDRIAETVYQKMPGINILGLSGMGVIGPGGPGESMHEIGMMAMCGPETEYATASATDVSFTNTYEKALSMAKRLKEAQPEPTAVLWICPLPGVDNLGVLQAFDEVFGDRIILFGGNSCDGAKAITSFQYHDGAMGEHDMWAIAFGDKTLRAVCRASHGNQPYGLPMTVTKAEQNRIKQLNGRPAWEEYSARLDPAYEIDANVGMMAMAMGEPLEDPAMIADYDSTHLIRTIAGKGEDALIYLTSIPEGKQLTFVARDEEAIFSRQARALDRMREAIGNGTPIAVFQMDCAVRGRLTLNQVAKDEFIDTIQRALSKEGETTPWFGIYSGGEYAPVAGKNQFHTYTTSLLVLYRA